MYIYKLNVSLFTVAKLGYRIVYVLYKLFLSDHIAKHKLVNNNLLINIITNV